MACALTLAADNATAAHIRNLWDLACVFEDAPSMRALGYPPHITLAIMPELAADELWERVNGLARSVAQVCVTFDAVRCFEGEPMVLWAAPQDVSDLAKWHHDVHQALGTNLCHEHYRPGNWIPHCSLATHVSPERRLSAMAFCSERLEPFQVVFDRFDCVEFPPVSIARRAALA